MLKRFEKKRSLPRCSIQSSWLYMVRRNGRLHSPYETSFCLAGKRAARGESLVSSANSDETRTLWTGDCNKDFEKPVHKLLRGDNNRNSRSSIMVPVIQLDATEQCCEEKEERSKMMRPRESRLPFTWYRLFLTRTTSHLELEGD